MAQDKVAISTRVAPELKAEMERLAEAHGTSVAVEVGAALESYIKSKQISANSLTDFGRNVLMSIVEGQRKYLRTTASQVASETGCSIKTVAATSGQLMKKGLVAKERVLAEDGKHFTPVNYMVPTPEGIAMAAEIVAARTPWEE